MQYVGREVGIKPPPAAGRGGQASRLPACADPQNHRRAAVVRCIAMFCNATLQRLRASHLGVYRTKPALHRASAALAKLVICCKFFDGRKLFSTQLVALSGTMKKELTKITPMSRHKLRRTAQKALTVTALTVLAALTAGCAQNRQAGTTAPASAAKTSGGVNANGEVVDSSKVAAGDGRTVKGRDNWEGEITGKPAANSKFTKLEIGMPMRMVTDMVGTPTDQGAYMTGKAWIPFYYGSDRHRYEIVYKGQGRLIFAGEGGFGYGSGNLIWIIHNPNESGYR